MPAATKTDRNRASTINRKIKEGTATAEERHWRDRYLHAKSARAGRAPAEPAARPAPAQSQPPSPAAQPPSPAPEGGSTSSSSARTAPKEVPIQFPTAASSAPPQPQAQVPGAPMMLVCNIPDCPECKRTTGALICGVTQKKVWPPMSANGARMLALGILGVMAFCAKYLRADRTIVPPNDKEKNDLSLAVREIAHRRINVLGAVDDLLQGGYAVGAYGARALMTPSKKIDPANPPRNNVTPIRENRPESET